MADLVLGPCLRYVDETQAVVWVETDAACEVDVLGQGCQTFHVEGHHYGLVIVDDLEPGTIRPYTVCLDGRQVWPEPGSAFPPSTIRTLDHGRLFRLVFGSCRVTFPHQPPFTEQRGRHGRSVDALRAYGQRRRELDRHRAPSASAHDQALPDALLLLGDQVYADEVSPETEQFIRSRRDPRKPPGKQVADFEEYTRLYRDAWSDPVVRWVLSTVPTAMIFDDHDIHDDWNTSATWVRRMRAKPWWEERIVGGLMAYWLYQHLGNLSPDQLAASDLLARVQAARNAGPLLRAFAREADRDPSAARWSYLRDFGRTRLIVIDSRAARVVDGADRKMVDAAEFAWIEQRATGGFDHLLLASSVPYLLTPTLHQLEAWNEAVCAGAWGRPAALAGEILRQGLDLEHWAAFGVSFDQLTELIAAIASGRRGPAPASIVALSGDVHHAYLAEVTPVEGDWESSVWQAVCSPMRNPMPRILRWLYGVALSRSAERGACWLSRAAGVTLPSVTWQLTDGPWFENQIATLELDGRQARFRLECAAAEHGATRLESLLDRCIVTPGQGGSPQRAENAGG